MEYDEALAYLDGHINLEARAGKIEGLSLEPVERLLGVLGDPHRAYPAIHVTGTNGKGSVAHMVSALLEAHGLRVGLYTSPHLEEVNERIALDREALDDDRMAAAIAEVALVEELAGVTPSYFEILTAAAFSVFATEAVDVAVVEVGLLGRFDATNVVDADVAIVTNVGKDHTDGAGEWRHAIAEEKAGIIKAGSVAVVGETDPALVEVFRGEGGRETWVRDQDFSVTGDCVGVGGRLVGVQGQLGRYEEVFVPLHGAHQAVNAAVALAAAEAFFGRPLSPDAVEEGLGSVELPGRFEIVSRHRAIVLDGAHNPEAMAALRATLDDIGVGARRVFVVGLLGGRDPSELFDALGVGPDDFVFSCRPTSPRAQDPVELAALARSRGLDAEAIGGVAGALEAAMAVADDADVVVVTGSLYVVGEARRRLRANGPVRVNSTEKDRELRD